MGSNTEAVRSLNRRSGGARIRGMSLTSKWESGVSEICEVDESYPGLRAMMTCFRSKFSPPSGGFRRPPLHRALLHLELHEK